jgi:hypothetical protein
MRLAVHVRLVLQSLPSTELSTFHRSKKCRRGLLATPEKCGPLLARSSAYVGGYECRLYATSHKTWSFAVLTIKPIVLRMYECQFLYSIKFLDV